MCGIYYGDEFDDCLKQVVATFSNLDLSQITIDDTVPLTPKGDDAVSKEVGDSIHTIEQGVKDTNVETIVQSAPDSLETLAI